MGVLKGVLKVGMIGCGSLVLLMVLLVAGLLAWDYVDQKLAERQEQAAAEQGNATTAPSPTA